METSKPFLSLEVYSETVYSSFTHLDFQAIVILLQVAKWQFESNISL